jgi:hypothetical protein
MSFYGYQQPEILPQHSYAQEDDPNRKNDRKMSVCLLFPATILKTISIRKTYRGIKYDEHDKIRRESTTCHVENALICDGILCQVMAYGRGSEPVHERLKGQFF